jgi:hypothetical protein
MSYGVNEFVVKAKSYYKNDLKDVRKANKMMLGNK